MALNLPPLSSTEAAYWIKGPHPFNGHIPHRVRAAWARLPSLTKELSPGLTLPVEPEARNYLIWRRCETDSIWEGRRAAMRWLIEFIGLHGPETHSDSCRITRFNGGRPFDKVSADGEFLETVWQTCTKATSHSTYQSGHVPLDDAELDRALTLIIDHLDQTIYRAAGSTVRAEALLPPP